MAMSRAEAQDYIDKSNRGEVTWDDNRRSEAHKILSAGSTQAYDTLAQTRQRMEEFTGRVQNIPTELEAVREALGLSGAYETFGAAGKTARDVAAQVEELPGVLQQQARGKDISANQLARIQASELEEMQPTITAATRGLESSQAGLQNLLSQYQTETSQIIAPYELEANLLSAQSGYEFDLVKTQISAQLDREIAELQSKTDLDVANIQRATELAKLESQSDNLQFVDLGDRVGIYDQISRNYINFTSKGKLGTLGDGW